MTVRVLSTFDEINTAFTHPCLEPPSTSVIGLGVTKGARATDRAQRLATAAAFHHSVVRAEPLLTTIAADLVPSTFPAEIVETFSEPYVWGVIETVLQHEVPHHPYQLLAEEGSHPFVPHFLAGHDTLMDLISSALKRWYDRPTTTPGTVHSVLEETLRFEPPVRISPRRVSEGFQLAGQECKQDDTILLDLLEGNLESPDRPVLSFGGGTFVCLGIQTARYLARIALDAFTIQHPSRLRVKELAYTDRGTYTQWGLERLVLIGNVEQGDEDAISHR